MSHSPPVRTLFGNQTELAITPSFSWSWREPSADSRTATYWYCDSPSYSVPEARLIPPGETASNAASATGASCQRAPSRSAAANASSTAVPSSVRCVPTIGIATSADANVPTMLPIVESA